MNKDFKLICNVQEKIMMRAHDMSREQIESFF